VRVEKSTDTRCKEMQHRHSEDRKTVLQGDTWVDTATCMHCGDVRVSTDKRQQMSNRWTA
jgi:hypothetical protein